MKRLTKMERMALLATASDWLAGDAASSFYGAEFDDPDNPEKRHASELADALATAHEKLSDSLRAQPRPEVP